MNWNFASFFVTLEVKLSRVVNFADSQCGKFLRVLNFTDWQC